VVIGSPKGGPEGVMTRKGRSEAAEKKGGKDKTPRQKVAKGEKKGREEIKAGRTSG